MRASDIVVGRTYGDRKGRERKVTAMAIDKRYGHGGVVTYEIVVGPLLLGMRYHDIGISAFARWAKVELTP